MKKKAFIVAIVVIIIGVIMVAIKGFNVDNCYKNYTLVGVELGKEYNISDIQSIANEVFSNPKTEIQTAGTYSDNIVIKVSEANNEQKELLKTKLNEKYGTELDDDAINLEYISSYRLRDLVKQYVLSLVLATLACLIYFVIRFKKIGATKVAYQFVFLEVFAMALYASVIAITRIPVNRLIMPFAVIIYFSIATVLTNNFEKQMKIEEK